MCVCVVYVCVCVCVCVGPGLIDCGVGGNLMTWCAVWDLHKKFNALSREKLTFGIADGGQRFKQTFSR